MSNGTNGLRICTDNLRVEYDGGSGPSHIVVPLVLPVGQHRDVFCSRRTSVQRIS